MPVEILGFEGLPAAGEKFDVVKDDAAARDLIAHRKEKALAEKSSTATVTLEDLFARAQAGATKELNIILKADVSGSVEAIRDSLTKLANEKVKVKVIMANPGGITESDVMLANASKAIIVGFNVRPETSARRLAEAEHVEIKTYQIIYELLDDVKLAMVGALDKKKVEKYLGRAEVRQTFTVPKLGTVAGCAVIDGTILRGANVRLLRDSRVIFDGKLATLRRFKDDAKEVAEGYECGMGIEKFNDIKIGDLIEAYQIDLVTPELTG
jgi:translation initiation factor IF-2